MAASRPRGRSTSSTSSASTTSTSGPAAPSWVLGPQWATRGLRQPGWMLLPLRAFLAVTFCYAGLSKLGNPGYLDPHGSGSVVSQMQTLRHSSPIGPLLAVSLHHPTVVGLLIAFGEVAVGVGVLLGLWTRLAALGGLLLSLTFFLTVSWGTTPYFYGSDIVFVFAWTAIAAFGSGDVLSMDAWLRDRARLLAGLGPASVRVAVDTDRLRHLCTHAPSCRLQPSGHCTLRGHCPVFATSDLPSVTRTDLERRRLLLSVRAIAAVGVAALAAGGVTAIFGRLAGSSAAAARPLPGRHHRGRTTVSPPAAHGSRRARRSATPSAAAPPGTALVRASAVPLGQARPFHDPRGGEPAWLVHSAPQEFVAFSAVCTHAGCTVRFDRSALQFGCPCHGGTFDARTGRVLGGPPPAPLPRIPVHVVNGQIRVD